MPGTTHGPPQVGPAVAERDKGCPLPLKMPGSTLSIPQIMNTFAGPCEFPAHPLRLGLFRMMGTTNLLPDIAGAMLCF